MEPVRILVVEDHPVVRLGLVVLLNMIEGFTVVGEASNGREALDKFRAGSPDVVLLDISIRGLSASQVTQEMRREIPAVRIIVMATYDHDPEINHALDSGAHACFIKGATTDEMVSNIRHVYAGHNTAPVLC